MRTKLWVIALAMGGVVAGCGNTPFERGATGGLIGAGVGEAVAGEPVAGAAVGAGLGATGLVDLD